MVSFSGGNNSQGSNCRLLIIFQDICYCAMRVHILSLLSLLFPSCPFKSGVKDLVNGCNWLWNNLTHLEIILHIMHVLRLVKLVDSKGWEKQRETHFQENSFLELFEMTGILPPNFPGCMGTQLILHFIINLLENCFFSILKSATFGLTLVLQTGTATV